MRLKNAQWEIASLPINTWPFYEENEESVHSLDDRYDESLVFELHHGPHEDQRVRVTRGAVWDDDLQLAPWKQMFIGYAKNALLWAKEQTGATEQG